MFCREIEPERCAIVLSLPANQSSLNRSAGATAESGSAVIISDVGSGRGGAGRS